MHSVLEHIAARRNKKVPIKDGRKIALVLLGGLMTGVRGGGAMIALEELGLSHAFDSIYAVSAGFCNACYLLTKNTRKGTSIYYENLVSPKFIHLGKFWNMVDTNYVIEVFKNQQPLDVDKLYKAKTKLFVGLFNTDKHKAEFIDTHKVSQRKFFELMRAAISIPYFHPGAIKIKRGHYKDYGITLGVYQELMDYVTATDATDILVIYNNRTQINTPPLFSQRIYAVVLPKDQDMSQFERNKKILVREKNRMYYKILGLFK